MSMPPPQTIPAKATASTNSGSADALAWADLKPPRSSNLHAYLIIAAGVVLCLVPFWRKAFNVDDPLFVWAAKQIVAHPLDPYGFKLTWNTAQENMWEVTKNPPLASYFAACIGKLAGFSESALHIGFLIPAIALVMGTYRLACRFTDLAWVAAAATLASPGFLVSATSVMCDTMMLCLFVWSVVLWVEGSDGSKSLYLLASALLIAACALTKYFGVSLLLLLPLYSILRRQASGKYLAFLLLPISILLGYQLFTKAWYGLGLLGGAAVFSTAHREIPTHAPVLTSILVGLSFTGGCVLPSLTTAALYWQRRWIAAFAGLSLVAGFAVTRGWLSVGNSQLAGLVRFALGQHWISLALQLGILIAAGISVLALAATSSWSERNTESMFLAAWILGTFIFAVFLNWTINARSLLPVIPAAAILVAKRVAPLQKQRGYAWKLGAALAVAGFLALWTAKADADWANSQRRAAEIVSVQGQSKGAVLWFQGHWGFQYYMEEYGARAVDFDHSVLNANDLLVVPANNIETFPLRKEYISSEQRLDVPYDELVTTMRLSKGSGFYSAQWGSLPFAFGAIRPERYFLFHLRSTVGPSAWDK